MLHETDDDAFETVLDRHGRPVRVLKDRRTARVTMMMHDANSVGRAVAADRVCAVISDGRDTPYALNRPGNRFSDSTDTSAAEQAQPARFGSTLAPVVGREL
jgi:hypothetical protein